MRIIDIERVIPAPIEQVFAFLTDTAHYRTVPGVLRAEVVRPGPRAPGGAGTVREVVLPLLRLTEVIEVYEPPRFMRYRIVRSIPPLRHEHGFMAFAAEPGGTGVRWLSEFAVDFPLLSGPLTRLAEPVLAAGFRFLLYTAARELSGTVTANP
ncbi:SRPBCC family protein [Nocardia sp. NPDC050193]